MQREDVCRGEPVSSQEKSACPPGVMGHFVVLLRFVFEKLLWVEPRAPHILGIHSEMHTRPWFCSDGEEERAVTTVQRSGRVDRVLPVGAGSRPSLLYL